MKKLLSLLFVFTLIACGGGSDDDESMGRTTDPFIGTWISDSYVVDSITTTDIFTVNSNGTWTVVLTFSDGETDSQSGTWSNNGSDFNSTTQIYTVQNDIADESSTSVVTFSNNFNSFTSRDSEITYTRQ